MRTCSNGPCERPVEDGRRVCSACKKWASTHGGQPRPADLMNRDKRGPIAGSPAAQRPPKPAPEPAPEPDAEPARPPAGFPTVTKVLAAGEPIECCGRTYDQAARYEHHRRLYHADTTVAPVPVPPHQCPRCPQRFTDPARLAGHADTAHGAETSPGWELLPPVDLLPPMTRRDVAALLGVSRMTVDGWSRWRGLPLLPARHRTSARHITGPDLYRWIAEAAEWLAGNRQKPTFDPAAIGGWLTARRIPQPSPTLCPACGLRPQDPNTGFCPVCLAERAPSPTTVPRKAA